MIVIGLTGGIGSGKSTVAQFMAELGAVVLNADEVGHEAYRPHTETWQELVSTFGSGILQVDEEINRKKLGEIVFADPQALTRLNQIVHPRMFRMMQERIGRWRERGVEVLVLEAAILFEANWTSLVDEIWVSIAPEEVVVQRLQEKGLDPAQVRARIRSQLPTEERAKRANVIIDNNGDLAQLKAKVEALWQQLPHRHSS